jgi:uncharacterized protein
MIEERGCEGPDRRESLGMGVVIPGGSGQLGQILATHFHEKGDDVTVIARNPDPRALWHSIMWNGRTLGPWAKAFDGADLVINLAGRSVNCRYTAENSRIIKQSRTETTRLVGQAIANATHPPPLWMNASTATIYRHTFDRAMDEATGELGGSEPDAPRTWRFSIDVAKSWEDLGRADRTTRDRMDDRGRHVLHAFGIRTRAQEPPGDSDAAARSRLYV